MVLAHCRWAEVRGRRSGRRELARRRAPPGGARRGGCGCGAARDDSIAPHPRRRRPPREPRRPALSAGAGARRPLRRPRARREARPISGKKRKGRAKTRGRRGGRGRRQSRDCRDPVTQAATRAFARVLERRKSDAPALHTGGWRTGEILGNFQATLPLQCEAECGIIIGVRGTDDKEGGCLPSGVHHVNRGTGPRAGRVVRLGIVHKRKDAP